MEKHVEIGTKFAPVSSGITVVVKVALVVIVAAIPAIFTNCIFLATVRIGMGGTNHRFAIGMEAKGIQEHV